MFMMKKIRSLEHKIKLLPKWMYVINPAIALLDLLFRSIRSLFGSFDIDDLESKLHELQEAGIIKNNCEGIEYLKDVFEKKEENHD